MRDLFMRAKPPIKQYIVTDFDEDAVDVSELTADEIERVCGEMGIQKISASAFEEFHAYCNVKRKIIYFSMVDVNGATVGYKKLSKNEAGEGFREETIPESSCFGVVMASPKRQAKDHPKHAILVVNMLDALAILMQKTQCTMRANRVIRAMLTCDLFPFSDRYLSAVRFQDAAPRVPAVVRAVPEADALV